MASEVANGKGIVKWLPSVRRYRWVTKTNMVKHPWGMKPTHAAGGRELRGMARVSRGGVGVSINGRCSRLHESVSCPTSVKDVLTLLGQSKRLLFHTRGVHVAGGMSSGAVVFTPRLQGQFSAPWN
jgi:hypothetical protein